MDNWRAVRDYSPFNFKDTVGGLVYQFDAERTAGNNGAHLLSACVLLLTGLGLVTLYSSSYAFADRFFGNSTHFVFRQTLFGAVGIVLFFVSSRIDLEKIRKLIVPLVMITVILCALTLVPGIGIERHGASRWIRIGSNSYQPSEMVKLVLPLYLAHIFDKKKNSLDSFSSGILPPVLISGIFFGLIYAQNNFSTAVFIASNALVMFFLAGVQKRWFAGAIVMFTPVATLMVLTATHRWTRVLTFLRPQEADIRGEGFQIFTSIRALNSGGFWGKGLGQGTWKLGGIPEVHSDMIISAFGEELGLLGVILLVAVFAIFAIRGYMGALRSEDNFARLLGIGLVTMIVSQALVNLAVTCGAIPTTGIPLPFFSAGGTYLTIVLIMAGFIANISRANVSHATVSHATVSHAGTVNAGGEI